MIRLSVLIITWNQLNYLKECLRSLHPVMERGNTEVIIVDNGSTDDTVQYIKQNYPNIRLLANTCNKGVAYARNRGLEIAVGDKILILDNDTVVNEPAISGMEFYMDRNPEAGLCTCRLVDSENRVQKSFKPFPGLWIKIKNITGISRNETVSVKPDLPPFEAVYVIGACQMIRSEVIRKIGLLDENIFYGPEDADYCLRIATAGWKVVYLPQFTIIHHWQRATNKKIFTRLAWKHICGLCYFYIKHRRIN